MSDLFNQEVEHLVSLCNQVLERGDYSDEDELFQNMKKVTTRIEALLKEEKDSENHKDKGIILHEDR